MRAAGALTSKDKTMPNEITTDGATTGIIKSSSAKKLIQAAALAAALVPLGSVAIEASSVTCGFGSYYGTGGSGGCTASSPTSGQFSFDGGAYSFILDFVLGLDPNFFVTVNTTTNLTLNHPFEGPDPFAGYTCIALSQNDGCVDFQVDTHGATSGTNWLHYSAEIQWNGPAISPTDEPLVRMLHDSSKFDGAEPPGTYDFDMCLTAGYDSCVVDLDPGIRSGDTDFDSVMAVMAPTAVPEPSSLILMATGMSTAFFRKRRRSKV